MFKNKLYAWESITTFGYKFTGFLMLTGFLILIFSPILPFIHKFSWYVPLTGLILLVVLPIPLVAIFWFISAIVSFFVPGVSESDYWADVSETKEENNISTHRNNYREACKNIMKQRSKENNAKNNSSQDDDFFRSWDIDDEIRRSLNESNSLDDYYYAQMGEYDTIRVDNRQNVANYPNRSQKRVFVRTNLYNEHQIRLYTDKSTGNLVTGRYISKLLETNDIDVYSEDGTELVWDYIYNIWCTKQDRDDRWADMEDE